MKHTILCVDDEADNVDALERLFRRKYNVLKALSAEEALLQLDQNRVSVIISDQRMPQMSGVEFLAQSIQTHPDTIRILLTGFTDIESVISAINSGHIYRYVTKPWDPIDLANAVDKAIERFEIGQQLSEKNIALQIALDELRTLDQTKNQFMMLVNHELKTPLTSMLSFAELLAETDLDKDQNLFLNRIQLAAHRLQDLINDVLEFVAAETGQVQTELKNHSAKGILNEALLTESIKGIARNRHLSFKFAINSTVATNAGINILCDERSLRNVMHRLLHNAVKFADIGSEIVVSGSRNLNGRYEIRIANSGPPIDERRITQLIKPFTLNENTMNHSLGTGLGLSVCQALLKLQGTSLDIRYLDGHIVVSFDLPADFPPDLPY
jgi:signal transduction histidine kinase